MEKQKKKQNGITLIALVISIIVMLILAGVSLNMTVGDNGIIKQAQSATIQNSVAMLQEYLQEQYVRNYENFEDADSKVAVLQSIYPNYFYIPANEGIGALRYVVNSDGNALYLIKKSGLPNDIKQNLVGGEAGNKTFLDYQQLNDVYGVTADLRVYYSAGTNSELLGISKEELDMDNPLREVFKAGSAMATLINNGDTTKNVSAETVKSIDKITIDQNSGITSLNDLYNLTSLKEVSLKNLNLNSLNGIQNCPKINYLLLENCTIGDYSAIQELTNLQYLYSIYDSNFTNANDEFYRMCIAMKNTDYVKLKYFGAAGSGSYFSNSTSYSYDNSASHGNFSDLTPISNLTQKTRDSITYIYFNANSIVDISALSGFKNVTICELSSNYITSTKGLENMNPTILWLAQNELGKNEVFDTTLTNDGMNELTDSLIYIQNKTNLSTLALTNNHYLKWISYLNSDTSLSNLMLSGCESLVGSDVKKIADLYNRASGAFTAINSNYKKYLNTSDTIDYLNYKTGRLTNNDDEILALYNNKDVKYLRLDGNSALTDTVSGSTRKLSDILATCTNLQVLSLRNLTNISSIEFVKSMPNLVDLDLWGCTNISDLSVLEECTNANKLHLKALRINNTSIDITKIQKTISGLQGRSVDGKCFANTCSYFVGGLYAPTSLIKDLNKCKNVTKITLCYIGDWSQIDLTGCTGLKSIRAYYTSYSFKLPSSVEEVTFGRETTQTVSDFSQASGLKKIYFYECGGRMSNITATNWFEQLGKCGNLEYLYFGRMYSTLTELNGMDKLASCKKLTELVIDGNSNTKTLTSLSGLNSVKSLNRLTIQSIGIKDLSALKELTNLTYLNLYNNNIDNIEDIKNLTKLTYFCASVNPLAGCHGIETLTSLETMDLQYTNLYDTSSYINGEDTVVYNNLQLMADLHKNHNLNKLYLQGCSNITDFSNVSSITNWSDRNGF